MAMGLQRTTLLAVFALCLTTHHALAQTQVTVEPIAQSTEEPITQTTDIPTAQTTTDTTIAQSTIDFASESFYNGSCSNAKLACDTYASCTDNENHTRFKCECLDEFDGDGYLSSFKRNSTGCTFRGHTMCKHEDDCNVNALCITPNGSSYKQCICKPGFNGSGDIGEGGCTDIVDCDRNPCVANAICKDIPGSFNCTCDENYRGDGYTFCDLICYNDGDCGPRAQCVDQTCVCDHGFRGEGNTCTDIDECQEGTAKCHNKSTCNNTPGNYTCECNNGYEKKGTECVPYHKNCDEMFKAVKKMVSGDYVVDFDGEGPAMAVKVYCLVKATYAVTEVTPDGSFPGNIPNQPSEIPVIYPEDTSPLVNNSEFCSQEVWVKCTNQYDGGFIQWADPSGKRYIGWGGNENGTCACGEVGVCPDGCYCGKGKAGTDMGLIIHKNQLPVSKVFFPGSSGVQLGTYFIGKLRCGPQGFDVPKDCHEAKFKYRITKNSPLYIDMDGAGFMLVYCNQEAYTHVGIIEIPLKIPEIKNTGSEGQTLEYMGSVNINMSTIINGSVFCSQRVEYQCQDTRTSAGVQVTTRGGVLNYFPGGSSDRTNSCSCGLTKSCDKKEVLCNCDIGDQQTRSDLGLIIEQSKLPVLNVKTTSSINSFTIGPLQCSQKQFGIKPNCEKLLQDGVTNNNTYLVDPDGPEGMEPFNVECEMNPLEGVSVVNNNGTNITLEAGKLFIITYLEATEPQVVALKTRSTICEQQFAFFNCPSSTVDISTFKYNGDQSLSQLLGDKCPNSRCPCGTFLTPSEKKELPLYNVMGSGTTMSIGALKCKEIFGNCESYIKFQGTVEGEKHEAKETLTIDPDGAGGVSSFVITCKDTVTTVDGPTVIPKPIIELGEGDKNPGKVCWKMNYTGENGGSISFPQMDALVNSAENCAQFFELSCISAMATGMVSYKTCGGKEIRKFVSGKNDATCFCGASGICEGGPDYSCNCDTSGNDKTQDVNEIISRNQLSICEVCMELKNITGTGEGVPPLRSISFKVSGLKCGEKPGGGMVCQQNRQQYGDLGEDQQKPIWMGTSGKPVVVGCRFKAEPIIGELIIRPREQVFVPGNDTVLRKITIIYRGFKITSYKEITEESNYCTQDILFFCGDEIPSLTGSYGIYSDGNRLNPSDYELRDMTRKQADKVCEDKRFADVCTRCRKKPKLLVVTNKTMAPVTAILLPASSKATVVVDDVTCAHIEKDCDAIKKAGKRRTYVLPDGGYIIDPDQAGPIPPFKVRCVFKNDNGITVVPSDPKWVKGRVDGSGGDDGAQFTFKNKYPTAEPEQIKTLVQISEFCWQGVKYECNGAPLSKSVLVGYNNQNLTSFGTADNSGFTGCACGVLGTCIQQGVSCNCDSKGQMADQGFVTDSDVLPIIGFRSTVEPQGRGTLTVTDLRCGPVPFDIPRDCAEAKRWGTKAGIDFTKSGEFLINPNFETVTPFLAYCDYSISPDNPVTIIKPKPTKEVPVGDKNPNVTYQGPDKEQLKALVDVSVYCYQPVKVDCYSASFIKAGVRYKTVDGTKRAFWSTGFGNSASCTCGTEDSCGGNVSLSAQKLTDCNCDIGDDVRRRDAAILNVKIGGPLSTLLTKGVFDAAKGQLNLTVGDVFCAEKPIEFDECTMGYYDCSPMAQCNNIRGGYKCQCPPGWNGKINGKPDTPEANGRECIDDDECTLSNRCQYRSVCQNTPGSYKCICKNGYRQLDDFTCEDIDECKEETDNCDENARCINLDGSFRCRCHIGFRGSGAKGECYPVGECSCFGDPHCFNYDNVWSHHQGLCNYVMTQNHCNNTQTDVPKFRVITNNWDQGYVGSGHYAWVKKVVVEVYNTRVVLGQGHTIMVNDSLKTEFHLQNEQKTKFLLSVTVVGVNVELYTDFGLEVIWNGDDDVTVYMPANLGGTTCGLCGNFNKNPNDDRVVGPACPDKEGQNTTSETLFGNSWAVNPECVVDCNPVEPVNTCDSPVKFVREQCDRLFKNSAAFKECFEKMPSKKFDGFEYSCEYDMCHSNDLGKTLCDMGTTVAAYCSELLAGDVYWKTEELCGEHNPEACVGVVCAQPRAHCVNGDCVCKMGYTADCQQCIDIDECATGMHNCKFLGQRCDNTNGSYECNCLAGFRKAGEYCENINECEEEENKCPEHAECHDKPGSFECACCLGYMMDNNTCIRNTSLDEVYGAPGNECCACTGKPCNNPGPVCGTDGTNYTNYRTMVVEGCRQNKDIEVDYNGTCTNSCDPSPCTKPFQTCQTKNGTATCSCPDCSGGSSSQNKESVCGSNKIVYTSQCVFEATMCETGRTDVHVESSLEPCTGGEGEPLGPWSEWSKCDNPCGKGTTRRTRAKLGKTNYPLVEETACYTTCKNGKCKEDTCTNPGQVCQVNDTTGKAECVCPDCKGYPDSPVCGLVGRVVRTHDNECLVKKRACERTRSFIVLEKRACENKPENCSRVRYFPKLRNKKNGYECISFGDMDMGFCYGGCGKIADKCCTAVETKKVWVTFNCTQPQNNNSVSRLFRRKKITKCGCTDV